MRLAYQKKRLVTFHSCVIESLLTYAVGVCYGHAKQVDRVSLDRVVKAAERVIGQPLPRMVDIFLKRSLMKANRIIDDVGHPYHSLCSLLPSGKCFRCAACRSSKLRNSFFPSVIVMLISY